VIGGDTYFASDPVIEILGEEFREDHCYNRKSMAGECKIGRYEDGFRSDESCRGKPLQVYETVMILSKLYRRPLDGKKIWIHEIGNILCDSDGNRIFLTGVLQDITQQKS
jgi:PAS domain-containing protein